MSSFREAVLASGNQVYQVSGLFGIGGKTGGAPTPFDALDGPRLAGPDGSHPLAGVAIEELLKPTSDGLDGRIEIDGPVRIGEGIKGRLELTARRDISARTAQLRLVGAVITEQQKSREQRDSRGNVTSREEWVEVGGRLFEQLPLGDVGLPPALSSGQRFEADFLVPAPRLGPPSGHLGTAVLAWALEARWDVAMGGDQRVAALVDVKQNIDYLRSGAVRLEQGAMFDAWTSGDASLAVKPLPPVAAGSEVEVTVNWPSAGGGQGARLELQAEIKAPNPIKRVVLWSSGVDPAALRGGLTVTVPVPADAPPTLEAEKVAVAYYIRALVDRRFRPDQAVERAIAVI
ncbi:MAG TPA: hypothetical protein VNW68_08160 [Candidatus Limnocylindria bacterium]|nr:hypothetical protein [Candidatus Limnocylindria bacterium]